MFRCLSRTRTFLFLPALLLLFILTLNCSYEPVAPSCRPLVSSTDKLLKEPIGVRDPSHGYYEDYRTPDGLMLNFTIAWRTMADPLTPAARPSPSTAVPTPAET